MALFNEKKYKKRKVISNDNAIMNEKNMMSQQEKKGKKKKIISSFADIVPIVDIAEFDFLEMRNGEFMEIIQVTSKDVYSLNENDKDNDIFSLAYLFQAFIPDIKLVPLHTPVNLELQKNNIVRNIRKCKEPAYIPFLEKKLAELEFIEEYRTNKEYFFFIYGDSVRNLQERKVQLKKLLARSNPIVELDISKKINVLYQLSNLNSKPKID
ncbi:hypothetical protein ACFSFY_00165 [Sporosarcina siberiensis]|uniref:Uncharacterized protein n=1 Tax=Sporosarcina siberiensis TaxID=1365606 RepID=A0ABW4SCW7_9BACL